MARLDMALARVRSATGRWFARGEVSTGWNYWNLYREIAWYGILSGVTQTFTTVFAIRLGASNWLVGLLTSLPALANVLFQLPAARLVERESNRRRVLLLSGLLMRSPALFIALVPLLALEFQASAVVYITVLGTIPAALSNIAFTAMLADMVAPQHRARVVSIRNIMLSAASTSVVLSAGQLLQVLPFPLGYQWIFFLAFLASLVSLYYVSRLEIPDAPSALPLAAQHKGSGLVGFFRDFRKQENYLRYMLASFLCHWGLHFPVPLYSIYRVKVLGLADGWIGALAMAESGATIIGYYIWGRVAHRRGLGAVLWSGLLLLCLHPTGMALSTGPWPLFLVSCVSGLVGPAFNLGSFNALLEVAPRDSRATYVAVFNTAMNITGVIGPLLGTAAAAAVGVRQALLVAGGLRLLGFVAFVSLFGMHRLASQREHA